jgi:hypothetical protein
MDEGRSSIESLYLDSLQLDLNVFTPLLDRTRDSPFGYFLHNYHWFSSALQRALVYMKGVLNTLLEDMVGYRLFERPLRPQSFNNVELLSDPYVVFNYGGLRPPDTPHLILQFDPQCRGNSSFVIPPPDYDDGLYNWMSYHLIRTPNDRAAFFNTLVYFRHPLILRHIAQECFAATPFVTFDDDDDDDHASTSDEDLPQAHMITCLPSTSPLPPPVPECHYVTSNAPFELLLDSCCNEHIFKDLPSALPPQQLKPFRSQVLLGGDRNHSISIHGRFHCGAIRNAFYAPDLKRNLISGTRLMEAGFTILCYDILSYS